LIQCNWITGTRLVVRNNCQLVLRDYRPIGKE
jgi:hypothetical protein